MNFSYTCYFDQEFLKARTRYIEDCYENLPGKDKEAIDRVSKYLMDGVRNLGVKGAHEIIFQTKIWRMNHDA